MNFFFDYFDYFVENVSNIAFVGSNKKNSIMLCIRIFFIEKFFLRPINKKNVCHGIAFHKH